MSNLPQEFIDDWKIELRDEIIAILTGNVQAQQNAYWKIGFHYNYSAPASLYKYYGDKEKSLENVKANKMWYSAPCKFNDIFDCELSVDESAIFECFLKIASNSRQIRAGSSAWKNLKQTMNQELKSFRSTFEKLRNTMGIACLSESDDSLLMWAHYANNHHGICVEYDLMEINKQLNFTPVPIIYSNNRVCFNTLNPDTAGNDSVALFLQSITSKSEEWCYEREWRIIRDHTACGDRWDPVNQGALLDMICPSSITLGCAANGQFEKSVKEYCAEHKIPLYKMQKDDAQYKLNKVSILNLDT